MGPGATPNGARQPREQEIPWEKGGRQQRLSLFWAATALFLAASCFFTRDFALKGGAGPVGAPVPMPSVRDNPGSGAAPPRSGGAGPVSLPVHRRCSWARFPRVGPIPRLLSNCRTNSRFPQLGSKGCMELKFPCSGVWLDVSAGPVFQAMRESALGRTSDSSCHLVW